MPPSSSPPSLGPLVVGAGIAVVVIGVLIWTGAFSWFGRLPGDLRYESGGTRVYVPLVSMLLLSIGLSVVVTVLRRFF